MSLPNLLQPKKDKKSKTALNALNQTVSSIRELDRCFPSDLAKALNEIHLYTVSEQTQLAGALAHSKFMCLLEEQTEKFDQLSDDLKNILDMLCFICPNSRDGLVKLSQSKKMLTGITGISEHLDKYFKDNCRQRIDPIVLSIATSFVKLAFLLSKTGCLLVTENLSLDFLTELNCVFKQQRDYHDTQILIAILMIQFSCSNEIYLELVIVEEIAETIINANDNLRSEAMKALKTLLSDYTLKLRKSLSDKLTEVLNNLIEHYVDTDDVIIALHIIWAAKFQNPDFGDKICRRLSVLDPTSEVSELMANINLMRKIGETKICTEHKVLVVSFSWINLEKLRRAFGNMDPSILPALEFVCFDYLNLQQLESVVSSASLVLLCESPQQNSNLSCRYLVTKSQNTSNKLAVLRFCAQTAAKWFVDLNIEIANIFSENEIGELCAQKLSSFLESLPKVAENCDTVDPYVNSCQDGETEVEPVGPVNTTQGEGKQTPELVYQSIPNLAVTTTDGTVNRDLRAEVEVAHEFCKVNLADVITESFRENCLAMKASFCGDGSERKSKVLVEVGLAQKAYEVLQLNFANFDDPVNTNLNEHLDLLADLAENESFSRHLVDNAVHTLLQESVRNLINYRRNQQNKRNFKRVLFHNRLTACLWLLFKISHFDLDRAFVGEVINNEDKRGGFMEHMVVARLLLVKLYPNQLQITELQTARYFDKPFVKLLLNAKADKQIFALEAVLKLSFEPSISDILCHSSVLRELLGERTLEQSLVVLDIYWSLSFNSKFADVQYRNDAFQEMSNQFPEPEFSRKLGSVRDSINIRTSKRRPSSKNYQYCDTMERKYSSMKEMSEALDNECIYISYCDEADEIVSTRLALELRESGKKVIGFFDFEKSSSIEARSQSIEDSFFVIICASQAYSNNLTARHEVVLAKNLRKAIVYICVEDDFRPTSWLLDLLHQYCQDKEVEFEEFEKFNLQNPAQFQEGFDKLKEFLSDYPLQYPIDNDEGMGSEIGSSRGGRRSFYVDPDDLYD